MKYILLGLLTLNFLSCASTQQPSSSLASPDYFVLLPDIQSLDIDPLGNLYVVDGNDRVTKFDSTGRNVFHIVNNNLGEVHSIDVGNPFKILMFYRDQQTILLLDRTLSEIQRIHLPDWKVSDVTAACLSPDNAIWIFNGTERTLTKMDDTGNPILTSNPFDIIRPSAMRPDYIFDTDQHLLLVQEGKPVSLFNDFAQYLRELEGVDPNFSLSGNSIIYRKDNRLLTYDILRSQYLQEINFTQPTSGKINAFGDSYYSFDTKGIYILDFGF